MSPTRSTQRRTAPDKSTLHIVETFGPTIQGEGPSTGRSAMFVRLAGCNLTCTWCDTKFSWHPDHIDPDRSPTVVNPEDVARQLDQRTADPDAAAPLVTRLVVTGGEPLLQASTLVALCAPLRALGWDIEVETSGTVAPGALADLATQFNVSPKLVHSGVDARARLRPKVLTELAALPNTVFKFVAEQTSDLDEVAAIVETLNIETSRVFVMAQATSADRVLATSRELVDAVVSRGWGLTPRWHTLLWEDQPGH